MAQQTSVGTGPDRQVDQTGQSILQLLDKAADVAEQSRKHAIDMAQRLAQQLRNAEDRIAELEPAVEIHRLQAERAEQWLHTVYTEIENRFLRQGERPQRERRARVCDMAAR